MIDFNEMVQENQPITITQFDPVLQVEGWFSNCRVDRSTIPEGWFVYDLREGEDGEFCTIEPSVWVNHGGTILLQKELTMRDGRLVLLNFEENNADEAQADYTF